MSIILPRKLNVHFSLVPLIQSQWIPHYHKSYALCFSVSRYFAYFLYFLLLIFVILALYFFDFTHFLVDWISSHLAWKERFIFCLFQSLCRVSTQSLQSVYTKEQSAKWARHHYMFNGIRLFVWPKKMEIRFTLSQSVTFKHIHIVCAISSKCSTSNRKRKVQSNPEITKMSWTTKKKNRTF